MCTSTQQVNQPAPLPWSPKRLHSALELLQRPLDTHSSPLRGSQSSQSQQSTIASLLAVAQYCETEAKAAQSMSFGVNGVLNIYKPKSKVKIYVSTTVPVMYRDYLVLCTQQAANDWNSTIVDDDDPRPRFQVVDHRALATCEVIFWEGGDPWVYASSFFPGGVPRITVYGLSFQEPHRANLARFLVHELVHVQGARHYHARYEDQLYALGTSVEVGVMDEFSVCAYTYPPRPPEIRPSDIAALKTVYSLPGDTYKGLRIVRHDASPMPYYSSPKPSQPRIRSLCAGDIPDGWRWDYVEVMELHVEEYQVGEEWIVVG